MFKFSGKMTRSQYWPAILLNFVFLIIAAKLTQASQDAALHTRIYYDEPVSGFTFLALFFWLIHLALYIRGMGITARRLRDAGKSRKQIKAYYWLILIPFTAPFALIYYFFAAGFTPSCLSAEEQEQNRLKTIEKQEKAEQERRRWEEEELRRKQARQWAEAEEAAYPEQTEAYREQADSWAKEEATKEQAQLRQLPRPYLSKE